MNKASLFFIILVLFGYMTAQSASALSCAQPRPPQEELGLAEAVFKGKLLSETRNRLHFEVSKVWKGEVGSKISLHPNGWTEFNTGQEYVVFVSKEDGKLTPRLCGNTGLASEVNEAALGEPIPMVQVQQSSGDSRAALLVGVTVLMIAGIVLIRRRKKPAKT